MVRYGFIRSKEEIKFLILTCMTYLTFPVNYEAIVDICTWCDDGFGYFELTEAFSELTKTGHVLTEDGPEKVYFVTEKGRETAKIFEDRLPFTVREAAQISAMRVVRKIRRDAQIISNVVCNGEKDFVVELTMEDVFSLKMNVVSKNQASMLEHNFKKNAEKIYNGILNALTKNYDEEET